MSAYQNFLDFFSMHNKERLDGLSECYFTDMTLEERGRAFEYLLNRVKTGGTDESVNGLFLADSERASSLVKKFLEDGVLREDAALAAAWNLYRLNPDASLLQIFVQLMSSSDEDVRAKAAYFVPSDNGSAELISTLKSMVRTETDDLAAINATNKLLQCYGITRDSVEKKRFSELYRGLRSEDPGEIERTFRQLDRLSNLE